MGEKKVLRSDRQAVRIEEQALCSDQKAVAIDLPCPSVFVRGYNIRIMLDILCDSRYKIDSLNKGIKKTKCAEY
jgi:hypothetical protein